MDPGAAAELRSDRRRARRTAFGLYVETLRVPGPPAGAGWRCCGQTFVQRGEVHRHVGTHHADDAAAAAARGDALQLEWRLSPGAPHDSASARAPGEGGRRAGDEDEEDARGEDATMDVPWLPDTTALNLDSRPGEEGEVLLFYCYCDVAAPRALCRWQRTLCERLQLTGKVRLAAEGLNGTVGGVRAATRAYVQAVLAHPALRGMTLDDFKGVVSHRKSSTRRCRRCWDGTRRGAAAAARCCSTAATSTRARSAASAGAWRLTSASSATSPSTWTATWSCSVASACSCTARAACAASADRRTCAPRACARTCASCRVASTATWSASRRDSSGGSCLFSTSDTPSALTTTSLPRACTAGGRGMNSACAARVPAASWCCRASRAGRPASPPAAGRARTRLALPRHGLREGPRRSARVPHAGSALHSTPSRRVTTRPPTDRPPTCQLTSHPPTHPPTRPFTHPLTLARPLTQPHGS
ncbi:thiosulfate sulfurtransferase/rhodanese-like domain-containing protein 2 isoform X3 [Lethenteron reissneri]|uniref:thiosulfate sulfurtransferase/rhodanese-like domain-containing protein 2 isoform X3 n=1 Tax=Lethenteron reissneri TaxID=7753 RepID=UPI002AB6505D|nr:thiosulfate sulfurtransferase/rhodanese-like domain-containing protein 2 isoform X3 [Lethenteron reissneri]